MKISDWNTLIADIYYNNFIPILGNELYEMKTLNGKSTVDDFLAVELLKHYNQNNQEHVPTLSEAVDILKKVCRINISAISQSINQILEQNEFHLPILNTFLQVDTIKFYFNTTVYHNLLTEELINAGRDFEGIETVNFSIAKRFKSIHDFKGIIKPTIFNFFGTVGDKADSPDPALSEEEMLEFTASFADKMSLDKEDEVLDALKNKSLLFIGCGHPEWLTRFFLRVITNERITDWNNRRNNIIVVNNNLSQKQYNFLKNYEKVVLYEQSTEMFVNELFEKWTAFTPSTLKPKSIFLSYASEDRYAVENFLSSMSDVGGAMCWYDNIQLRSGNNYNKSITESIRDADLFIPFLSRNCQGDSDRYVKREWTTARNFEIALKKIKKDQAFIMPVLIDDLELPQNFIYEYFPEKTVERLPNGVANNEFKNHIKKTLRLR